MQEAGGEDVAGAFRPVVVLLHAIVTSNETADWVVTNAFRPVVVLLHLMVEDTAKPAVSLSPMPFGLLWCCYLVSS